MASKYNELDKHERRTWWSWAAALAVVMAAACWLVGSQPALAANIPVTSLLDNGGGSLRSAASLAAPGDVITFGVSGAIILTSGPVSITHRLTISGPGASVLAVSGNHSSSVFSVAAGARVQISGLTIKDGSNDTTAGGGGINNNGALTLTASTLRANTATWGGGIGNYGAALTVIDCQFISNTSDYFGGGIYNAVQAAALVTGSTFVTNSATFDGGGIYNAGLITVTFSTFISNTASEEGGGIANIANAMLILDNSAFTRNSADFGGGVNNNGLLAMSNSTFISNQATYQGGGLANGIVLLLDRQAFRPDTAALNESVALVTGSTFISNSAGSLGGGIVNSLPWPGNFMQVTNSTLTANTSSGGGGIGNTGFLSVVYSTLVSNTGASTGGNLFNDGGYVTVTGAIVAHGLAGGSCSGSLTSNGHNLSSDATCPFTSAGDISRTPTALLGRLQNNGGPTLTLAPLPGSPAINHGANAAQACPSYDQRGVKRPQGGICDIGAVESLNWPRVYLPLVRK